VSNSETGPEMKQRLIFETAAKGELGLKLCARHYYLHAEGSPACMFQNASDLHLFFADKRTLWLEGYE